jgi:hypothetical protein
MKIPLVDSPKIGENAEVEARREMKRLLVVYVLIQVIAGDASASDPYSVRGPGTASCGA